MTDNNEHAGRRSLFGLVSDLPRQLIALVKAELNQLKVELSSKAKHAAVGIGLFAAAAFLAFFAFASLITAAILALALVLPGWLASLIVVVALLVIAGILALVGVRSLKKGTPIAPVRTIESVRGDVNAVRGLGRYDR